MFARGEVKGARLAPARHLDIAALIQAIGHVVGGEVGDRGERVAQRRADRFGVGFQPRQAQFQSCHFGHQRCGGGVILGRLCRADRLGGFVAPCLACLCLRRERPVAAVVRQNRVGHWRKPPAREAGVERGGIVPDETDIVHGRALSAAARRRKRCVLF